MEQANPFVLTGCAFDYVEGRFPHSVRDAARLARRMYRFCPDLTEAGREEGSLEIAERLRRTQRFSFWWG